MRTASEVLARAHLAKAEEYWLGDQLGKAHAAMALALNAGVHPSDVFDIQRIIDAELAARTAGDRVRIEERLIIEAPGMLDWRVRQSVLSACLESFVDVSALWHVRWGKPVLLTIFGSRDAALFLHSRYGYYAERRDTHKICLPPDVAQSRAVLTAATRHEIAHAAVHEVAGDRVRRWLDEGIAVWTEGGTSQLEIRRLRLAATRGTVPSIAEIETAFGNYDVDLDSGRSTTAYAVAGSFVAYLVQRCGLEALRRLLRTIRESGDTPRTFRKALGVDERQAETAWRASLSEAFRGEPTRPG